MRKQFRASAMRLGPDGQRRSFSFPPMTAPAGGAVIARPVTNRVWRHVRRAGRDHEGLEQILKPLRSGDWLCRRSIFSTSRITLSGRSPHCLKLSRRHRLQQRVRCARTCSLGVAGDMLHPFLEGRLREDRLLPEQNPAQLVPQAPHPHGTRDPALQQRAPGGGMKAAELSFFHDVLLQKNEGEHLAPGRGTMFPVG